jgi:hypothetical protein
VYWVGGGGVCWLKNGPYWNYLCYNNIMYLCLNIANLHILSVTYGMVLRLFASIHRHNSSYTVLHRSDFDWTSCWKSVLRWPNITPALFEIEIAFVICVWKSAFIQSVLDVSFSDIVSCYGHVPSIIDACISMVLWWNDSDREKSNFSEKTCPNATFFAAWSTVTGLGTSPEFSRR